MGHFDFDFDFELAHLAGQVETSASVSVLFVSLELWKRNGLQRVGSCRSCY
jgi:hypothetical protein